MLLLVLACLQPQRVDADAGCIKCHENQVDDWKGSAHERNAVGCVKCHGADSIDGSKSRPHLYTPGFKRGTKKSNPMLCGACHAMELKAYDLSGHAEDTRDDSGKMKGCTTCHDFHATAPADRRAILKNACSQCHKAGSQQIRWAERYDALADRLRGEELKSARAWQHGVSNAFLQRLEKPVEPAPDAYNTKDRGGRSPWPSAVAGMIGVAALATWALRKRWRQAS